MKSKRDEIVDAARDYVKTRKRYTQCQQKHFKQLCYRCSQYANCKLYTQLYDCWLRLQRAVK